MRIAIDARKLEDYGIGSYLRGLVGALAAARPEWTLVLIAGPDARRPRFPANVEWRVDRAAKYGLAELRALPRQARAAGADLFHAPHYVFPAGLPCPGVVTIHDCIHLRFPRWLPRPAGLLPRALSRQYALRMMRHAGRAAARVLTVSEASADDLVELVGLDRRRITVVPNGCDAIFLRPPIPAEIEVAHDLVPATPYALFVGNDKPHKNLTGLLRAHAQLASEPPLDLVIVGGAFPAEASGRRRVRALGRVSAPILRGLLAGARMAVVPSLYEGFGLPALEAMAAGVPVIASRTAGLSEVVGEAALSVPPGDDEALRDALIRLRDHDSLHARLVTAGRARAAAFSWERAAAATATVYEQVVEAGGRR